MENLIQIGAEILGIFQAHDSRGAGSREFARGLLVSPAELVSPNGALETLLGSIYNPPHGDWKASATDDHPLVTLIHFGSDDPPIVSDSDMLGWWEVLWRGTSYYYFFEKSGRVGWTKHRPANLKQPLTSPDGRGYWFQEPFRVSVCWTDTGSFEVLAVRPPRLATHMEGTWNGSEQLVADKM